MRAQNCAVAAIEADAFDGAAQRVAEEQVLSVVDQRRHRAVDLSGRRFRQSPTGLVGLVGRFYLQKGPVPRCVGLPDADDLCGGSALDEEEQSALGRHGQRRRVAQTARQNLTSRRRSVAQRLPSKGAKVLFFF